MSVQDIQPLLNDLQTQIEADNFAAANETFDELAEVYRDRESAEQLSLNQSQVYRETENLSPEKREELLTFERQYAITEMGRIGLLSGGSLYLLDPTQTDKNEIVSQISEMASREVDLQNETERVASELEDITVPPHLNVLPAKLQDASMLVDSSTSVSLSVQNVGTESATGVTADVSAPANIEISPSSHTVGTLAGEATKSVTFKITSGTPDDYEFELQFGSENAGTDSKTLQIAFKTPVDVSKAAQQSLSQLEKRVGQTSLNQGIQNSLVSKLSVADSSLNRAIRFLQRERAQPAEGVLTDAINQLGAFINEVDAVEEQLSESFEAALTTGAEEIINTLARARDHL